MLKIGITGGIGSGKTFIAKIFTHLGIPVYYADQRTKELYNTNKNLKHLLITTYGKQIYLPSGHINIEFLRNLIFNNPDKRKEINKIVHPFVIADFNEWYNTKKHAPYILKESALLFETETFKQMNFNILVTAPNTIKIKRIQQRDKIKPSEIRKIMATQMNDKEKKKKADFIIINNEKKLLLPQVITIHQQLTNK